MLCSEESDKVASDQDRYKDKCQEVPLFIRGGFYAVAKTGSTETRR